MIIKNRIVKDINVFIKKGIFICLFLLIISNYAFSVEFGLLAGRNTTSSKTTLGFSAGMGFFIPMVKFEFEMMKQSEAEFKEFGVGVKIRKKIGNFAPYVVIGAGTKFNDFSIIFSGYDYFTYIGGGMHYYIFYIFSLRFDLRYQSYNDKNNIRLSVGIFAHI